MRWCKAPLATQPKLVQIARSTHGDLRAQSWIIERFWGFHLYSYAATLVLDGEELSVEPGMCGFTPPGALAEYRFKGRSTHLFAHLDWPDREGELIPSLFSVGPDFERLWAAMDEAVGLFSTQHLRAEVRVWDVVLSAAAARDRQDEALPLHVRKTFATIDQRLAERLTVSQLAAEAFLSHNHLTRIFKEATGLTVIEAIQSRRMERARHLLLHSTMPVKQVASQVGIPDLQQFNKAIRRRFGVSPTSLREEQKR